MPSVGRFLTKWIQLRRAFHRIPALLSSHTRDLLTVEQAAEYLQLSQSSIRSYIRQGKLNAFRVAGKRKVLIPRSELLKLLEPARGVQLTEDDTKKSPNHGRELDYLQ